jgi:hypothetical protein
MTDSFKCRSYGRRVNEIVTLSHRLSSSSFGITDDNAAHDWISCRFTERTQKGEKVTWDDVDNPNEPRTLFQSILKDREMRVDKKTLMADRPSFCVITAADGKAIRLEFYEGHDALSLIYDIRSKELQGKRLPNFMDEDPQAYDPARFLRENFGIPEELSKPILDKVHEKAD